MNPQTNGTGTIGTGTIGTVWIVGAGPGDPGLLTVKAARVLEQADVVLYDRLVGTGILELIPEQTERIYVGKGHGDQESVQPEIMTLLEQQARLGKTVVRLKGGDPFVFGRGAEEWAHLAARGVPVEIVPGISSSLAVPALAGIPLTFRNLARAFAVVTGHRSIDETASVPQDWSVFAHLDTLVILMGVGERAQIARELIEAGRDPLEPCAFIERGSTPRERMVISSLKEVESGEVMVEAPAVWVIGQVVKVRELLRPVSAQIILAQSGSDQPGLDQSGLG
jgi:uroporphyrin-III C-methyltransferase